MQCWKACLEESGVWKGKWWIGRLGERSDLLFDSGYSDNGLDSDQ